ncbi:MAG TPA: glycosyltransferase [Candidatus Eisenbacteria bacterium]
MEASRTPLRIAILLPHLGVYGGIRRFLELGRVWSARGHDVLLAVPRNASPREAWLPFPGRIGALEEAATGAWDAVLSPDPALFLDAVGAAGRAVRIFYAVLERAPRAETAWRRADLVIANSSGMIRHLARRGIRAVDGIGGVNGAMFRPPAQDARPARARGGAPLHALVYGRLSRRRKGSWRAAKAIEAASRRSGVPVTLTLFDAPPPQDRGAGAPLPLSIPHRWVLNPSQEELAALYGDADLFVSAERRAGWCNTAAEAMACGAAVACTPSGTEDFAVRGETAAVSRWPWTWALAGAVARLLRDPALRGRIAEAGRRKIGEFTWERAAASIERAIRSRMEERRHGGTTA